MLMLIFNLKTEKPDKVEEIQIEGNNYNSFKNETNVEMKTTYSTNSINLETSEIFTNENENDTQLFSPFVLPTSEQTNVEKFKFFFCWPFSFLFYITIPNVENKRWQKFYLLTFFMSLVWLSIFSYIMVWMITIIGKNIFYILIFFKKDFRVYSVF